MLTPDQIRLRLERLTEQGDACAGCLALIAVLHAVLPELVAPPAPLQRPESPFRDFYVAACRRCQVEIRAASQGALEDGIAGHVCQELKRVAVTNQDLWEWSERVRHTARPCPDCTPDAPCKRVRQLAGEAQ